MPLFFTLWVFLSYIKYIHIFLHSYIHKHSRDSSPFHHRYTAQWQTPPWGAESGLGLPTELRRIQAEFLIHLANVTFAWVRGTKGEGIGFLQEVSVLIVSLPAHRQI
jgi:hypothetical protein